MHKFLIVISLILPMLVSTAIGAGTSAVAGAVLTGGALGAVGSVAVGGVIGN